MIESDIHKCTHTSDYESEKKTNNHQICSVLDICIQHDDRQTNAGIRYPEFRSLNFELPTRLVTHRIHEMKIQNEKTTRKEINFYHERCVVCLL